MSKEQEGASDSDRLHDATDRAARIDELERKLKADGSKLAEKKKELKRLQGTLVEDLLNPDQGRLALTEGEGAEPVDGRTLAEKATDLEGKSLKLKKGGKAAKPKAEKKPKGKGQKAKVAKKLPDAPADTGGPPANATGS